MSADKQIYYGLAVAFLAFYLSKIHITMETFFIIVLAVALAISLFFNYRMYCVIKLYQRALSDVARKQLLFMAGAGITGLLWGKIIADRLAGRDE